MIRQVIGVGATGLLRVAPFFTGPWPMKLTLSTPFRRKHHAKTK
jgi:hypothetical protein